MIRWYAIWSVLKRNVLSYFSGILGYLVIVVFVTVAAFCAFSPRFFANNLANLDQLSAMFPYLLLAIVPAITMSTWADEKKQGTDEILFTLPASDKEILLGKFLSALAIYSIVLAFSLTQLFALAWIGDPDWGVVATTYLGYWLAGAALISIGMFASVLTGSTTVAYVLGATFCAIPVLIGTVAPGSNFIQSLSLNSQLRDFTSGMVPLTGVLYFIALILFMLYLNMVFISRRHWSGGQKALMGLQYFARAIGLAMALISLNFMANTSTAFFMSRIDMTSEGLYTLTPTTRNTIDEAIKKERAVTIQAFLSPDVPREYVHARKQLVGLLRQYERMGGTNVDVRFVDVKSNSKEAKEARTLGVEPKRHSGEIAGKLIEEDVYLGAVITSNLGEVVIPFFDGESSMEYELTRSIATITERSERLKVGVLETDAMRLEDQFMFRAYDRMIEELREQYKLINITPERLAELAKGDAEENKDEDEKSDTAEAEDKKTDKEKEADKKKKDSNKPDVLLVIQPSSLTESRMADLVTYIEKGNPVLLLDDPLPFFPFVYYRPEDIGVVNAPKQERPSPDTGLEWVSHAPRLPPPPQLQAQIQQMQQQLSQMPPQFAQQMMEQFYAENPEARARFEPKVDGGAATSLMDVLGIQWNEGRAVWDNFDPHAEFSPVWPKEMLGEEWPKGYGPRENLFLFVASHNGAANAFSPDDPITKGLQEMVFFYAGTMREKDSAKIEFIPLINTGPDSGLLDWDELTYEEMVKTSKFDRRTGEETEIEEPRRSRLTGQPLRRITERPLRKLDKKSHAVAAHVKSKGKDAKSVNVVFVADIDFVSDMYFEEKEKLDQPMDNLTFIFNALEVLAGNDTFAALRNRRPQPDRLVAIQETVDAFRLERAKQQAEAEQESSAELKKAQDRLNEAAKKIEENKELGIMQKLQMSGMAASSEQRRFDLEKARLDSDLRQKIEELKSTEQEQIDRFESRIRFAAVLLPALPALFLGILLMSVRIIGEQSRVVDSRRRH